MPECPDCGQELKYDDYFGLGIPGREGFRKTGDIYQCDNEDCPEFQSHFYTRIGSDELNEGYPC